jgi:imidazolonepropionase-like amidohydrolase
MKTLKNIILSLALVLGFSGFAQQTPARSQTGAISITGATAHLGNGQTVENATVVFENGKITAVGGPGTASKGELIDAAGKHVYPGFIAPAKPLGLIEVNAVRASNDQDEIGDFIPNICARMAY